MLQRLGVDAAPLRAVVDDGRAGRDELVEDRDARRSVDDGAPRALGAPRRLHHLAVEAEDPRGFQFRALDGDGLGPALAAAAARLGDGRGGRRERPRVGFGDRVRGRAEVLAVVAGVCRVRGEHARGDGARRRRRQRVLVRLHLLAREQEVADGLEAVDLEALVVLVVFFFLLFVVARRLALALAAALLLPRRRRLPRWWRRRDRIERAALARCVARLVALGLDAARQGRQGRVVEARDGQEHEPRDGRGVADLEPRRPFLGRVARRLGLDVAAVGEARRQHAPDEAADVLLHVRDAAAALRRDDLGRGLRREAGGDALVEARLVVDVAARDPLAQLLQSAALLRRLRLRRLLHWHLFAIALLARASTLEQVAVQLARGRSCEKTPAAARCRRRRPASTCLVEEQASSSSRGHREARGGRGGLMWRFETRSTRFDDVHWEPSK